MGEIFKKPVFIIIFAVALVGALIWSYVDNRRNQKAAETAATTEQPQIVNLTNVDPTDFDSAVKDEYALANTKAAEANTQNKLAAIDIELAKDLLPNSGNTRYVFSADNDKNNNWVITISQSSRNYIRALIPKADYMGEVQQMNTSLWKFNYVTALQIAEKNGGLDWREKNELQGVKISLQHLAPKNWLTWTVVYEGKDSINLTKKIDANSGQIIEETASVSNSQ